MSQSTADLVMGWRAERATIEKKIVSLRTGAIGHSLAPRQRAATIKDYLQVADEFESLIEGFGRCEDFATIFEPSEPDANAIGGLRFAASKQSTFVSATD
jgi:hypothetical protein